MRVNVKDKNKMPKFIGALRLELARGLDDIGETTVKKIQSGFASGSDALGGSWAPLDEGTIRQKGSSNILVDSGALRDSYSHTVDKSSLTVSIGTEMPYAIFHETGTERMPKRPVLIPAATWLEQRALRDQFEDAISNAARLAGVRRSF